MSQTIRSRRRNNRVGRRPLCSRLRLEHLEPRRLLAATAKNVILLIGDGMGPEQVEAGRAYLGRDLLFESFPYQGELTTYAADNPVTDSAAAATALATGVKVNNGVISLAYPGDGSELTTSLEIQRDWDKMTGLVTTTYITHATPAGFGAHEPSRNNLSQIAGDYLNQTRPNVLLGGGANGISVGAAQSAGYTVVQTAAEMFALDTNSETMVSGQFGGGYLPYEYDGLGNLPHLSEMTATALDILDNDPDGFFLMVEGGRIDHACHDNDIVRATHEAIEFDNTVDVAYTWASGRTDTLIIVTADHETGGLTATPNGPGQYVTASWSSTGHTAANVPAYAWGTNAEMVGGVMDNIEIFPISIADNDLPTAAVASPEDNGPEDSDPAVGSVSVTTEQGSLQIQLDDEGSVIDDSTVVQGVESVTKNTVPLVEGTDYTFSYDGGSDLMTLTPIGGPFGDGSYELTLNSGVSKIADQAANQMATTALTVTINIAPPVISGVGATAVTDDSSTIVWTTDKPADSLVDYGLDTGYGLQASDAALVTSHSIDLTGLTPSTTYHYRVTSEDAGGNPAQSGDFMFTTLAPIPGINVSPTSGLLTTETGGTDTFTVVLDSQPAASVTVGVSSGDTSEGLVSTGAGAPAASLDLTFGTGDWDTPQTVTVTGQDDLVEDGSVAYTIVTDPAVSTDPAYNNLNPADVSATNTDDDTAGVIVTESGGSTDVSEGGVTDDYTVVLTSQPTGNVTVNMNPDAQVDTLPTSLLFTPGDWSTAQPVSVSAVDDAVVEDNHTGTITHSASSADGNYNGISIAGVTANITDNDFPPPFASLGVIDGYDEKNEKTLQQDDKTYIVQSSDDDRWGTEYSYYTSYEFEDVSIPSGATIVSVVVYVEHYEEDEFGSGALQWSVGTGWPGSPTTWGSTTATVHQGENNEATDSWDVTSLVDTPAKVNSLELQVQNNDNGAEKKTYTDYLYTEVEWAIENLLPVAVAGSDQTLSDSDGTGAEIATLDGTGSFDPDGTIVSYEWKEGVTVLGNTAVITPSLDVGVHTITLTVTDDGSATDADTVVVTVDANIAPTADAGADQTLGDVDGTGEEIVTLDGSNSSDSDGTIVSYEWKEGVTVLGTTAVINPSLAVGVHNITLTVTDNGSATDTDTVVVTIDPNQVPTADAGVDQTLSDGDGSGQETTTLDGSNSSDPDGTIASYEWKEGVTVLGTTAVINPSLDVGVHTITLTVTDNGSATDTDTVVVTVDANQAPTADAGVDQTFGDGDGSGAEAVTLDGSNSSDSDGTVTGYEWKEGVTVLGTTAVINPSLDVGVHTITLTVTDNGSATDTDTVVVTVDPNQAPTADAGPDQNVTDVDGSGAEVVTLDGTNSSDPDGSIASYEWKEGVTVLGTTAIINPSLAGGAHTITLTVTDNGGATDTDTVLVTVSDNQAPTADAGVDQTLADVDGSGAETATLDGTNSSDPDGTITGYEWKEGVTVLGTTAVINPSLAVGVHTITLTVTDNGSATDTDTVVVTVDANQAPTADAGVDQALADTDGSGAETATLDGTNSSDPDGSITGYEWKEGVTVLGTTAVINPSLAVGVHTITLTVTDDGSATDTDTVVVTVNANQAPTADAGPDQNGDEGSSFSFDGSNSFDPDGTITDYDWTFGDTGTATGATPNHVYTDNGVYVVTLTVTDDGGATDVDTATVTVVNVAPTANAGGPYSGIVDTPITFAGSANDPGADVLTYEWDFSYDGATFNVEASGVDLTGPSNTYTTDGSYTVALRVSDDDGGISSISQASVTVDPSSPPETVTLTVIDGYDQKNGKTLEDDGKTYTVQTSDDDRWETEYGYWTSYEVSDIPAGSTIISVIAYVEHYEEGDFASGALQWNVGTGWESGGAGTVWASTNPPVREEESAETTDSWDVTDYFDGTLAAYDVNDLQLRVDNNDSVEQKKTKADYIYVEVTYQAGGGGAAAAFSSGLDAGAVDGVMAELGGKPGKKGHKKQSKADELVLDPLLFE